MLYIAVLLVHVVVCIFLIIVVLLQSGKAADLAGAFGGMGSQTAFGPRGSATLLSKATTVSAVIFMLTSLSLSILATNRAGMGTTVLQEAPRSGVPTRTQTAPVPLPGSPNQAPAGSGSVTVPLPLPPPPQSSPKQAPASTPPAAPKK
jgi:preprotein translocase subunit SecG